MNSFCTVVDAPISGKVCPLKNSPCVWVHRKTQECKYIEGKDVATNPTKLALLVGVAAPTDAEVQELRQAIQDAVKAELST